MVTGQKIRILGTRKIGHIIDLEYFTSIEHGNTKMVLVEIENIFPFIKPKKEWYQEKYVIPENW